MTGPVLYAVVTGAPPAKDVGALVDLACRDGWRVCVVATPDAERFLDGDALAAATGYPVVSGWHRPGQAPRLPPPDALVVAPASGNTLAKLAAGISDSFALGVLVEAVGRRAPLVLAPFSNDAHLAHPALVESVARLRSWGASVLTEGLYPPHPPGPSAAYARSFAWGSVWAALTARPDVPPALRPSPDPRLPPRPPAAPPLPARNGDAARYEDAPPHHEAPHHEAPHRDTASRDPSHRAAPHRAAPHHGTPPPDAPHRAAPHRPSLAAGRPADDSSP
ncbi:flavoprotein [Streptomyces uncialis]|uniref:flavoprotein n=1 Tax=Streptomyces uncialis TaxID=1048205 RepID=UPI00093B762C|nr:flavoprotein [Streptomyces uncialis]